MPAFPDSDLKWAANRLGIALHKRAGTTGQYLISARTSEKDEFGDDLDLLGVGTVEDISRLVKAVKKEARQSRYPGVPGWIVRRCWQQIEDDRWTRVEDQWTAGQGSWEKWRRQSRAAS